MLMAKTNRAGREVAWPKVAIGLPLGVLGIASIINLVIPPQNRFLSPGFDIAGPLALPLGVGLIASAFEKGRKFGSGPVLWSGIAMLALGVFPWLYTPLLIPSSKEQAANLGGLLFVFLGLPGICLTLTALAARAMRG